MWVMERGWFGSALNNGHHGHEAIVMTQRQCIARKTISYTNATSIRSISLHWSSYIRCHPQSALPGAFMPFSPFTNVSTSYPGRLGSIHSSDGLDFHSTNPRPMDRGAALSPCSWAQSKRLEQLPMSLRLTSCLLAVVKGWSCRGWCRVDQTTKGTTHRSWSLLTDPTQPSMSDQTC
jgi:hypothetical protein